MLVLKQDLTRLEQDVMSVINAREELRKDLAKELKCVKNNHDSRITQLEGIVEVQTCIIIHWAWSQVAQLDQVRFYSGLLLRLFFLAYLVSCSKLEIPFCKHHDQWHI